MPCSPPHQTIHTFRRTCRHVWAGTHTNYTNYKITTGQLSKLTLLWKVKSVLCVCVRAHAVELHVCAVELRESRGPCRALGVLIRQPQPSRVHHREKERIEGRERLNRGWSDEYMQGSKQNSAHLLRKLVEGEGERKLKDDNNWNVLQAVISPGSDSFTVQNNTVYPGPWDVTCRLSVYVFCLILYVHVLICVHWRASQVQKTW